MGRNRKNKKIKNQKNNRELQLLKSYVGTQNQSKDRKINDRLIDSIVKRNSQSIKNEMEAEDGMDEKVGQIIKNNCWDIINDNIKQIVETKSELKNHGKEQQNEMMVLDRLQKNNKRLTDNVRYDQSELKEMLDRVRTIYEKSTDKNTYGKAEMNELEKKTSNNQRLIDNVRYDQRELDETLDRVGTNCVKWTDKNTYGKDEIDKVLERVTSINERLANNVRYDLREWNEMLDKVRITTEKSADSNGYDKSELGEMLDRVRTTTEKPTDSNRYDKSEWDEMLDRVRTTTEKAADNNGYDKSELDEMLDRVRTTTENSADNNKYSQCESHVMLDRTRTTTEKWTDNNRCDHSEMDEMLDRVRIYYEKSSDTVKCDQSELDETELDEMEEEDCELFNDNTSEWTTEDESIEDTKELEDYTKHYLNFNSNINEVNSNDRLISNKFQDDTTDLECKNEIIAKCFYLLNQFETIWKISFLNCYVNEMSNQNDRLEAMILYQIDEKIKLKKYKTHLNELKDNSNVDEETLLEFCKQLELLLMSTLEKTNNRSPNDIAHTIQQERDKEEVRVLYNQIRDSIVQQVPQLESYLEKISQVQESLGQKFNSNNRYFNQNLVFPTSEDTINLRCTPGILDIMKFASKGRSGTYNLFENFDDPQRQHLNKFNEEDGNKNITPPTAIDTNYEFVANTKMLENKNISNQNWETRKIFPVDTVLYMDNRNGSRGQNYVNFERFLENYEINNWTNNQLEEKIDNTSSLEEIQKPRHSSNYSDPTQSKPSTSQTGSESTRSTIEDKYLHKNKNYLKTMKPHPYSRSTNKTFVKYKCVTPSQDVFKRRVTKQSTLSFVKQRKLSRDLRKPYKILTRARLVYDASTNNNFETTLYNSNFQGKTLEDFRNENQVTKNINHIKPRRTYKYINNNNNDKFNQKSINNKMINKPIKKTISNPIRSLRGSDQEKKHEKEWNFQKVQNTLRKLNLLRINIHEQKSERQEYVEKILAGLKMNETFKYRLSHARMRDRYLYNI